MGAEGLFFLPHLMGERGPEAEPLAEGALVGLTLRHGRGHVVRAVLEGTAMQIRRLLEASAGLGGDEPPIGGLACGGGAHSALWMQILCDVAELPLRTPAVVEAGVLGAAMLAGAVAEGTDLAAVQGRMVRPGATYTPRPEAVAAYEPVYRRYCQLDRLLMPWFREVVC
jgi:xylulokinase